MIKIYQQFSILLVAIVLLVFIENTMANKLFDSRKIKNGDLLFQADISAQSLVIQLATNSIYNHVGIVFYKRGKPYVLEAIGKVTYTPFGLPRLY